MRSNFAGVAVSVVVALMVFDTHAQVSIRWQQRHTNAGNDSSNAIVRDAFDGSIWVTGQRATGTGNSAFCTFKYSSAGALLAGPLLYGPDPGLHAANAIAIDQGGSVYVTGQSPGAGSGMDYATLKYDFAGNLVWVRRYNNPSRNDADIATAVAVVGDQFNRFIAVTGRSLGGGGDAPTTGFDFLTVCYDDAGNVRWTRRYNHSNQDDAAVSVGFMFAEPGEAPSSVVVAGNSFDAVTYSDVAVVAYSQGGFDQWLRRWDNPEVSGNDWDQIAEMRIESDNSFFPTQRIYLTGSTLHPEATLRTQPLTPPPPNTDYLTLAFGSGGFDAWSPPYRLFNGAASKADAARGVTLTPPTIGVPTGAPSCWVSGYVGAAVANDMGTVSYDSVFGAFEWASVLDRAGKDDYGADLAAAAIQLGGPIVYPFFLTGGSQDSASNYDYRIVKYDGQTGAIVPEWAAIFYTGVGLNDHPAAVTTETETGTNAYVTGRSQDSGTGDDSATVKFGP